MLDLTTSLDPSTFQNLSVSESAVTPSSPGQATTSSGNMTFFCKNWKSVLMIKYKL